MFLIVNVCPQASLFDIIMKNIDKIKVPRSANAQNMYQGNTFPLTYFCVTESKKFVRISKYCQFGIQVNCQVLGSHSQLLSCLLTSTFFLAENKISTYVSFYSWCCFCSGFINYKKVQKQNVFLWKCVNICSCNKFGLTNYSQ